MIFRPVRAAHECRQLFADVYSWAGSYRVTELRLGDDVFARRSSLLRMMRRVEMTARALVADHDENHDSALARQLARLYADYNYIHPFREGNGRVSRLLSTLMALQAGLPLLDFSGIKGKQRAAYFAAVQAGMGRNYAPMAEIFRKVVAASS